MEWRNSEVITLFSWREHGGSVDGLKRYHSLAKYIMFLYRGAYIYMLHHHDEKPTPSEKIIG